MSHEPTPNEPRPPGALESFAGLMAPFGPGFFLTQLGAFVREHCPSPTEGLPLVHIHLSGGEVLDLCHVIALAPRWAALAVFEGIAGESVRLMRTEIVPYDLFVRITIRTGGRSGAHIGFHQEAPPVVHELPEQALQAAAQWRGRPGESTAAASDPSKSMSRQN